MSFVNTPHKAFCFCSILLTITLNCPMSEAQSKIIWQAAVVPNELKLYAQPSSVSRVATALKGGDLVNVNFELNVSGDNWCRVEVPSQVDTVGYVMCRDLERKVPPVPTQPNVAEKTMLSGVILADKDIFDMNKAGLPPSVLIAKIKSSTCNFDTSPSQLQELKAAGVSDTVILAMVEAPAPETKRTAVVNNFAESPKSTARNNHPSAANAPSSPISSVNALANVAFPPVLQFSLSL